MIAKSLRTIPRNYTRPLPSRRIEGALRGAIYDPYIRQIMYEGVLGRFRPLLDGWTRCPPADASVARSYPISDRLPQVPLRGEFLKSSAEPAVPPRDLPPTDDGIVCPYAWAAPLHQLNCDIIWPAELDDNYTARFAGRDDDVYGLLTSDVDSESAGGRQPSSGYLELDTPAYSGRIKDQFLVEQLLAMGGIRLAAILNYLFADPDAQLSHGLYVVDAIMD